MTEPTATPDELFSLRGQTYLITGGTRGIGRAIALRFARAGAGVIANYVRDQAAAGEVEAAARSEKLDLRLCRADLTSDAGLERVAAAVAESSPGTLGIVHCAATGVHRPLEQLTARHLAWTWELNVQAFFKLIQLLRPRLSAGSSVLAVTSLGATRAFPHYSLVGASKGALDALTRHLAAELAPAGIRVNLLCPGTVLTDAWKSIPDREARVAEGLRRTPAGRFATPDEVAAAAQFLCSRAAGGIVGHTLVVDQGASILG